MIQYEIDRRNFGFLLDPPHNEGFESNPTQELMDTVNEDDVCIIPDNISDHSIPDLVLSGNHFPNATFDDKNHQFDENVEEGEINENINPSED